MPGVLHAGLICQSGCTSYGCLTVRQILHHPDCHSWQPSFLGTLSYAFFGSTQTFCGALWPSMYFLTSTLKGSRTLVMINLGLKPNCQRIGEHLICFRLALQLYRYCSYTHPPCSWCSGLSTAGAILYFISKTVACDCIYTVCLCHYV